MNKLLYSEQCNYYHFTRPQIPSILRWFIGFQSHIYDMNIFICLPVPLHQILLGMSHWVIVTAMELQVVNWDNKITFRGILCEFKQTSGGGKLLEEVILKRVPWQSLIIPHVSKTSVSYIILTQSKQVLRWNLIDQFWAISFRKWRHFGAQQGLQPCHQHLFPGCAASD